MVIVTKCGVRLCKNYINENFCKSRTKFGLRIRNECDFRALCDMILTTVAPSVDQQGELSLFFGLGER